MTSDSAAHGMRATATTPCGVGDWTVPFDGGERPPYLRAASAILDAHEQLLDRRECIVAGDFNASAQSSPEDFPKFLEQVRDRLACGRRTTTFQGVEPGEDADMTLRQRRWRCEKRMREALAVS